MLLLSRTVSVTSWQVHLKLIMLHFAEFCPAPGAGACKHEFHSVSPWQPVLTFQRFRAGLNRSVAFLWAITVQKCLCQEIGISQPTMHGEVDAGAVGCLSLMHRKGNIWLLPTGKHCIILSTYVVQLPLLFFLQLVYCPLVLESFCSDNAFSFA